MGKLSLLPPADFSAGGIRDVIRRGMLTVSKGHDLDGGAGSTLRGMRGEEVPEAVLFVGEDPESAELLRKLRPELRERVRIVDVNGLRGWLYVEYGTSRTPVLVTESRVVVGLQEILAFLSERAAHP